jgi:signal recognition particle subunit SRP54
VFGKISESFKTAVNKIRHFDDEKSLKKALDELKKSLLKADVHHKVVKELIETVSLKTKEMGIGKDNFLKSLSHTLTDILSVEGASGFVFAANPPTVILMTGLQGSGKTTTTGKLGNYLKSKNKKVLLAAGDLQRMAAVEQLKQIGEQIEVDVFADEEAKNPIDVATRAIKKANDEHYDVVIVDSAGRLAIDDTLMDELKSVKEAINPHEIFYVADSLTGQDAVKTAQTFSERIGIDGVILTKFDGDTTGGVALGLAKQINVPLRFIGVGEKMPDLELFIPERIVGRLMGAGDVESLAERVGSVIDEKKAKELTKKMKKGAFNFNDFLDQMENMKKIGSMKSILGMIPGMQNMANQLGDIDFENSKEILHIKALISSMTLKEREAPDLLNASRKKRIAKGAGLSEVQVNKILKQFKNASKMAKKFSGKKGMKDLQAMMGQMGSPAAKLQ